MSGNEAKGRIPMLERDQVPPEMGALYDVLLKQRGVVPNMFKMVANAPALALGFAAFLKPLLGDGALPGWYKELVLTRMSVLLSSYYAVTKQSLLAKQKQATDEHRSGVKAGFERTEAETVGLGCAGRLHRSAREIDEGFFAKRNSSYNDQQILELIATAATFECFPCFVEASRILTTPVPENTSAGQG